MVNDLHLVLRISVVLLLGSLCHWVLAPLIDLVPRAEGKAPAGAAVVVKHPATWLYFDLGEPIA